MMNRLARRSSTTTKVRPYCALAAAIGVGILLLMPGCCIPKLPGPQPGAPMPDTFNGVTNCCDSAPIGWREFFNDPQLLGLIDQGLNGNQELKILYQDIQIAYNEVQARKGAYWPFVSLLAHAGLAKPSDYTPEGAVENQLQPVPGVNFPNPLPDFLVAAEVTWEVDIWRRLRNARDAAGLRYLGTADGQNYIITRLVAEIAEQYYELMALDNRMQTLDRTIQLQENSLETAKRFNIAGRDTLLPVQRFEAEVRRNQSEKLIIQQDIVQVENRINFLLGRYPQRVERDPAGFLNLNLHSLAVGVPSQLLQYRSDIRQAERELQAAGLDVRVARARFFPALNLSAGVGYEAFNTKYLFLTPESLIYNVAGDLVGPLINRRAIKADYLSANARQLQAVYEYQKTVLNAFTEVINRITKVQNYSQSVEIKRQQVQALESSVEIAMLQFQTAQHDTKYIDVLLAQRDMMDARMVLIDTKQQQLSAIINAYQALGGGGMQANGFSFGPPCDPPPGEAIPAPAPMPSTETIPPGQPVQPGPGGVPAVPPTNPGPIQLELPPPGAQGVPPPDPGKASGAGPGNVQLLPAV